MPVLVGLMSTVPDKCGTESVVYTKTSYFLGWIDQWIVGLNVTNSLFKDA